MKQSVAIIGGGASALLLAAFLDEHQFDVTIYEQNKALGRKLLVAGKGGFNLTHSEPLASFIERYSPSDFLSPALSNFSNEDLRQWLAVIGIPTFVGSSKRIYPTKGIKPITVLKNILGVLEDKGVNIQLQHRWNGWNDKGQLIFNDSLNVQADYTVFALGGGSWKVTGSDGSWLPLFAEKDVAVCPFLAANCAVAIHWPAGFLASSEGQPLKNIRINCGGKSQPGEVVITRSGIEGNAIYALSPQLQQQLQGQGQATIHLDLKPSLDEHTILARIQAAKGKKTSDILRKTLKLSAPQFQLIKTRLSKEEFLDPVQLAAALKHLPLSVLNTAPLDEAISTSGGIDLGAVNAHFELQALPHHYCIGEMLDWNAPTGGYLLQACFSMGVYLARRLNGG